MSAPTKDCPALGKGVELLHVPLLYVNIMGPVTFVAGFSKPPTAMQNEEDTHDTPLRKPLMVVADDNVSRLHELPLYIYAIGTSLMRELTPTATQNEDDTQDTPIRTPLNVVADGNISGLHELPLYV